MSTNINQSITAPPLSTSSSSSDSSISEAPNLDGVNGPSEVADTKKAAASAGTIQDAYGAVAPGARGNVLSTQPTVPTDTTAVSPTSLRSGQSKVDFLGESKSIGDSVLTLKAENPASLGSASTSAATTDTTFSQKEATTSSASSNSSGLYDESGSTSSATSTDQAAETAAATKKADGWADKIGKKCKHPDADMQKQTGLSASTIKQAHALMKNSNTTDYKQQVATALAVLAQEKKSGSSSYKADAETVKTALQTMTDNADTRGSGSANSTASVKSFDGALSSLSSVVTGHLGSDPSGGAPKTELFDPTNNPTVVNSWA